MELTGENKKYTRAPEKKHEREERKRRGGGAHQTRGPSEESAPSPPILLPLLPFLLSGGKVLSVHSVRGT